MISPLPLVVGTLMAISASAAQAISAAASGRSLGTVTAADTILTVDELARELGPGGNQTLGRGGLRALADSAAADEATLWAQLLVITERADVSSAPVAVRAVALGVTGLGPEGAEVLVKALPGIRAEDRAALLALAVLLAERDDPLRAAELRERFLAEYPDAPEMPEVALRQARWLVSINSRREEGVRLLEELIVKVPNHPVIPEARRIYQLHRTHQE